MVANTLNERVSVERNFLKIATCRPKLIHKHCLTFFFSVFFLYFLYIYFLLEQFVCLFVFKLVFNRTCTCASIVCNYVCDCKSVIKRM